MPRRGIWTTTTVCAALVVAAGVGFLASRALPGAAPPTPSAVESAGGLVTGGPETAATEPSRAPEVPSSPPEPSVDPAPSASQAPLHPSPRVRPAGTGVRARPDCNPPYTITADGVRQYKPACVK
jgi:hypothetical protein